MGKRERGKKNLGLPSALGWLGGQGSTLEVAAASGHACHAAHGAASAPTGEEEEDREVRGLGLMGFALGEKVRFLCLFSFILSVICSALLKKYLGHLIKLPIIFIKPRGHSSSQPQVLGIFEIQLI